MFKPRKSHLLILSGIYLFLSNCKLPQMASRSENKALPATFSGGSDTSNSSKLTWHAFFTDKNLAALIDTGLKNNQELNITFLNIQIAQNDIRLRRSAYLPTVGLHAGAGIEKVGRYTSQGAGDASTEIIPGKEVPEVLPDFTVSLFANWEVDIWKKLRNAKKAAVARYLSSVEGKNFVLTNLITEIANNYYELLALDNQLMIIKQNINIQNNALGVVRIQKEASHANELAVQKFVAEVARTRSLEFDIRQNIKETENRINFLLARYPHPITRTNDSTFLKELPSSVKAGLPSQLLANRPDIRQAELELSAAKLDVKVAKAEFYPSFGISGAAGFQAFKPAYLIRTPESLLYSLAGDLAAPLVNRNAIRAEFNSANARQLQAMYNYERTILNAYIEVSNQLSNISNLSSAYDQKLQQVNALTRSISISNDLFRSARADYLEVLMTQRDALESRLELVETRKKQYNAITTIYQQLGGGWR